VRVPTGRRSGVRRTVAECDDLLVEMAGHRTDLRPGQVGPGRDDDREPPFARRRGHGADGHGPRDLTPGGRARGGGDPRRSPFAVSYALGPGTRHCAPWQSGPALPQVSCPPASAAGNCPSCPSSWPMCPPAAATPRNRLTAGLSGLDSSLPPPWRNFPERSSPSPLAALATRATHDSASPIPDISYGKRARHWHRLRGGPRRHHHAASEVRATGRPARRRADNGAGAACVRRGEGRRRARRPPAHPCRHRRPQTARPPGSPTSSSPATPQVPVGPTAQVWCPRIGVQPELSGSGPRPMTWHPPPPGRTSMVTQWIGTHGTASGMRPLSSHPHDSSAVRPNCGG
jgi:hypothetical protein